MPAPFRAFLGGSYPATSPHAACERTINFIPEYIGSPGAKAPLVLYPTPGVEAFATAADTPVRALGAQGGRVFAVVGTTLYEVASDGTLTDRGDVAVDVGTDPAQILANGDGGGELLIVSGGHAYLYTLATNTLTDLMSGGSPLSCTASQAVMLDGYFVILDGATSTLYQSDLLDGTTWDGAALQLRNAAPDPWVAVAVLNRDLWVLGEKTSEIWYNAGTTPWAFAMHAGGLVPWGCAAPFSVANVGDRLIWLGQTTRGRGQVVAASGLSPQVISTPAIDQVIQGYATTDDAVAWTYDHDGHQFYLLQFPTADTTLVYDLSTGLWHERGTWNSSTSAYEAWRPCYHTLAFGEHLVGDRNAGELYTLSSSAYLDADGAAIRRVRRANVLNDSNRRLSFSRFEVDLEPGLGTGSGEGADPEVELNFSNNAAKTWATAGARSSGSGAQGEYTKRVFWTRLGSARNRVFEIVCADPAPYRITAAYLDMRLTGGK